MKHGIEKKLDAMLTGKLAIYDNQFGTDWETVMKTIEAWVRKNEASVVIIDNLMALDIPTGSMDKYDAQSRIVKRFAAMAKELNVHIHFICHPRKTDAFLRKCDISGSADLTNAADNVFMVHRVNADFMCKYRSVYPKLNISPDVGNVIEIMKNRDLGVVDEGDYLSILKGLGAECLGAIQIIDDDYQEVSRYEKLKLSEVQALANEGATKSAAIMTETHLSLAGASGKVGLYWDEIGKNWYLPKGLAPSTYIVKQSHVRLKNIVANEQLVRSLGK